LVDHVVVPYFSTAQKAVTTRLLRMDLIALLIFSISGLVIGSLQAQKHFLFPALAPIFYNVGQIIGVFVLVPALGIYGLALGVILGAILHLLIQVPALVTHGFRWSPSLDLRSPGLRKAAALMGPRILTVAVIQAIFVYTDRTASGMVAGSITALTYGWLILQVPETLIGSALGTVLLPTFSELADRGSLEDLRRMVRRAFLVLLGLTLPVVALGVPMMETAVRLVFEGRAFTPEDTGMVTATARLLLLGLPAHAWIETAVRVLYSRLDARTPLWAAAATTALFILLCILFSPALQYRGVALANTLSFSMEALLLLGWLRLRRLI
jgi:putative peptidoglycan lipid II flippase